MSLTNPHRDDTTFASAPSRSRLTPWPLVGALAGLLGSAATMFLDSRAGDTDDMSYTVSVADMPDVDHVTMRIGGLVGYLAVAALLVFAALWHRRVTQRFAGSVGASVVQHGLVASAGTLALAYGWKGAIGNYAHDAMEAGTYDDAGLYTYYVMNDFSPFIAWFPVLVALAGIAHMAFREHLLSRGLGSVAALISFGTLLAVVVTGVPGLPFAAGIGLLIVGVWLAFGHSVITREVQA